MRGLLLLACMLVSATAGAADQGDTVSRRAKALFEEGLALSDEGNWTDALTAFQKSDALVASLSARYNIGASLRALGRYVEAEHTLEGILGDAQPADSPGKLVLKPALRHDVEGLLAQVKEKIVVVEVQLDPIDARAEVDGTPLVRLDGGNRAELDPGRHVFVVRAPGHETTTVTKTLSRDDHELALTAPRTRVVVRAGAPEPFYMRGWFWTAAAVVVAGAAVAVVAVEAQPAAHNQAGPPSSTTGNTYPAGFRF